MATKTFRMCLCLTLEILIILKKRRAWATQKKGVPTREIKVITGKSSSTVNENLQFLEEQGYVVRKRQKVSKKDGKDVYHKVSFITKKGLDLLNEEILDKIL